MNTIKKTDAQIALAAAIKTWEKKTDAQIALAAAIKTWDKIKRDKRKTKNRASS